MSLSGIPEPLAGHKRLGERQGDYLIVYTRSRRTSGDFAGLPKGSVADLTQAVTLDEAYLAERAGRIAPKLMEQVDAGLSRARGGSRGSCRGPGS